MKKMILLGLDGAVPTVIEEYVKQGLLPHFKRLMEQGYYTRALSSFPGVTPVNWATIATGSNPGTHGIVDFVLHEPGEPLTQGHSGFSSDMLQSETMWEALTRQGYRTATLNFPGSWPPRMDQMLTVAGEGSPATHSRFELRASSCFATAGLQATMREADLLTLPEATIHLLPEWDPEGHGPTLTVSLEYNGPGNPVVRVKGNRNVLGSIDYTCTLNQFSPWFQGTFEVHGKRHEGTFRVLLSRLETTTSTVEAALYVSQVMPKNGITIPDELGQELIHAIGPFIENSGGRAFERGWVDDSVFLREGEYKGLWLARAARYLIETDRVDAVFAKWHFLDHVQHLFWGYYDSVSPWYLDERAQHFEEFFQHAYQVADAMLGEALAVLGPDDVLAVVSDHGHIAHLKAMSINNLLVANGLITLKQKNPPVVDWTTTKAYAGPCLGHIHINLKGREPHGSVDPSAYAEVQQTLIKVLREFRDPETGAYPVQLAIPIEDGKPFGQWGPRAGDVLYFMEAGYTGDINWFPLTEDGIILLPLSPDIVSTAEYGEGKFIASKFQSAHGCGLPSRTLGRGTEEAICFLYGPPKISSASKNPVAHLLDVAPTLAELLGIDPPNQSEGRSLIPKN